MKIMSYYDTLGEIKRNRVTIGRSAERPTWQWYAVVILVAQIIAVLWIIVN